jgi:hypothetical protein
MRRLTFVSCLLLFTSALALRPLAQEPSAPEAGKAAAEPAHYYRLELVVQELGIDGKPANSRSYKTTVSTNPHDQFTSVRTNSKIPIPVGPGSSQYQYQNVGVNIDVHNAREVGRELAFELHADISSVPDSRDSNIQTLPVIRQNQWQAVVLIPIGKPTVVCTSDTLDSKGSMQLVVTATPLP